MTSARLLGLISFMSVAACGPVFAQQGTEQQREACTPDAFRLCMSAMPDSSRVETCLRAAGPRLSPACAAVFNPPQTTGSLRDRRVPREQQQRDRDYGQRYDAQRYDRRDYRDRDEPSRGSRESFAPPPRYDDDD